MSKSSKLKFSKKFKKASHTNKRRLSPIKEGKHEDKSVSKSSHSSSNKHSPKELIMISRQKKSTYLLNDLPEMMNKETSNKNSKTNSKTSSRKIIKKDSNRQKSKSSLIKSIKNIFSF
jgi:hypothetical protein